MNDRRWVEQLHDDIARVVDHRLGRAVPQTRYGVVFGDPDTSARTVAVRLGGSDDPSPGFVYGTQAPLDGDLVRVVVDPKGDRYVDEVLGRELLPRVSALPPAGAPLRGRVVLLLGAAGVADAAYVCRKLADETYGWAAVTLT